jgi:uncharacterized protein (TIGR00297 family)
VIAALAVSLGAWRLRSLAPSGAIAATLLGAGVTAFGGWGAGAVLIIFFVTSSALSRIAKRARPHQNQNVARGSQRDAWQVAANGGIALTAILAWYVWKQDWILAAFAASLSTAAADTWATELGALNRTPPRLLPILKRVAAGTSGAISRTGTVATIAGALLIAAASTFALTNRDLDPLRFFLAVWIAGVCGSLVDSLLGAFIQVRYRCPACNERTERLIHRCGSRTVFAGGFRWMNNDVVNITAILAGTAIAALLTC